MKRRMSRWRSELMAFMETWNANERSSVVGGFGFVVLSHHVFVGPWQFWRLWLLQSLVRGSLHVSRFPRNVSQTSLEGLLESV